MHARLSRAPVLQPHTSEQLSFPCPGHLFLVCGWWWGRFCYAEIIIIIIAGES